MKYYSAVTINIQNIKHELQQHYNHLTASFPGQPG